MHKIFLIVFLVICHVCVKAQINSDIELLNKFRASIPNSKNLYNLLLKPCDSLQTKSDMRALSLFSNKNFLIRIIQFSDLLDSEKLIELSKGKKRISSANVNFPKYDNVDSINNAVFPVFPISTYWLSSEKDSNYAVAILNAFDNSSDMKKTNIVLKSSSFDKLRSVHFKDYYLYGLDTEIIEYISLITVCDGNNIQSFWVQGLGNLPAYFSAINCNDSSKGYKNAWFQKIYKDLKLKYIYDDYCPDIIKLSFLSRIIDFSLTGYPYNEIIEQFYRKF